MVLLTLKVLIAQLIILGAGLPAAEMCHQYQMKLINEINQTDQLIILSALNEGLG